MVNFHTKEAMELVENFIDPEIAIWDHGSLKLEKKYVDHLMQCAFDAGLEIIDDSGGFEISSEEQNSLEAAFLAAEN